jgi:branched-chain amino acid transport system substrate-binding protein
MRGVRHPVWLAVLALLACAGDRVLAQPAPAAPRPGAGPALPVVALAALLPVSGPGAWFGAEIRQGLALALAELNPPRQPRSAAAPAGAPPTSAGRETAQGQERSAPEAPADEDPAAREGGEAPSPSEVGRPPSARLTPPTDPIEAVERRRTVELVLKVQDVQPLDVAAAAAEFHRVAAGGTVAVFTASPTPTLTVYPLATARNVLVVYCGLPTDRFPATSRTLLRLRPSFPARAERLAAYARERGVRRLALLADGDEFGRSVRATVAAAWRRRGDLLAHEESLSPDASDLRTRLRSLVRAAPGALVLGYRGEALGTMARAARAAGYRGALLAADDDRAALLAGGEALEDARLLGDAFVARPGTRGERFARAYTAKHGSAPSRFAAAAYDAAVVLADAATRLADEGREVTGGRLQEALLAQRRFPSLFGGEAVVGDDGTLARPLALFRVERGQAVFEGYVGPDGRLLGPPRALGPGPRPGATLAAGR